MIMVVDQNGDLLSGCPSDGIRQLESSFLTARTWPNSITRTLKRPLWVKSDIAYSSAPCPLFPSKRTFISASGTSAKCQKRTLIEGSFYVCIDPSRVEMPSRSTNAAPPTSNAIPA